MKKVMRTFYPNEVLSVSGTDYEFVDAIEVRERVGRHSFDSGRVADSRDGKRNGKRRSRWRPPNYRGETRVQVLFLRPPIVPKSLSTIDV